MKLKNETHITSDKNITLVTEEISPYIELSSSKPELLTSIHESKKWHCEKPVHFDDHVISYGCQRDV